MAELVLDDVPVEDAARDDVELLGGGVEEGSAAGGIGIADIELRGHFAEGNGETDGVAGGFEGGGDDAEGLVADVGVGGDLGGECERSAGGDVDGGGVHEVG